MDGPGLTSGAKDLPSGAGASAEGEPAPRERRFRLPASLDFLLSWVFLNAAMNVRYPMQSALDPPVFWLLPSPEVTALLALFCVAALVRVRIGAAAIGVLVSLFLVCRLHRIADGIARRYFARQFSILSDWPLVLELPRLLYATMPWWLLSLAVVLFIAGAIVFVVLVHRSLRYAQNYLTERRGQLLFAGIASTFLGLSLVVPPLPQTLNDRPDYRVYAFSSSVTARLAVELDYTLHVLGYRDDKLRPLKESSERLSRVKGRFERLGRANVLLFFIEAYGSCVESDPQQRAVIEPLWDRVEQSLTEAGYGVRSGMIVSPTYGGASWRAHATMATGAKIADQFTYNLVLQSSPRTMAQIFNEAGYRTVHVSPATTRAWIGDEVFGFQAHYNAWELDYRGRRFGFALMPDQYVISFMHRREVTQAKQPLYIEYALVSSHAPFDVHAQLVDDWSRIGDGSIYNELPPITYPHLNWTNLDQAQDAYVRSLVYDFDVLAQYLTRFIQDGSLIILLGDHQPVPEVGRNDPSFNVPVHVISRNRALLEPFARRGYASGMRPAHEAPRGMETFVHDLVSDFN